MTVDDLKETAVPAHLNLDKKELAEALPAFEQMLKFFSIMETAGEDRFGFPSGFDTTDPGISQTVNPGFFRPDETALPSDGEILLNNAGRRDGNFFVIPQTLDSKVKPAGKC